MTLGLTDPGPAVWAVVAVLIWLLVWWRFRGRRVRGFLTPQAPPSMNRASMAFRVGAWIGGSGASWPFITMLIDRDKLVLISRSPFTPPVLVLPRSAANHLKLSHRLWNIRIDPELEDGEPSGVTIFTFPSRRVRVVLAAMEWLDRTP